jgi:hypothetical protein
MSKIKAYFNQVRALQNSDHPYEENRTQFDEDIEVMIDLWAAGNKPLLLFLNPAIACYAL